MKYATRIGRSNHPQTFKYMKLKPKLNAYTYIKYASSHKFKICVYIYTYTYVVGSKSFRPDIQKPRQIENAVRDI